MLAHPSRPRVCLFAGCMIGPNYQRPKVSVSQSFGEAGDPRLSAEQTNYRDWWKAFNDPVLDRLIARAYRDNLTLQQAGVRVLEARAQLGITVGEIFPQTQQAIGSVQYNRTSDRAATAALPSTAAAAASRTGSRRSGPRPAGSSTSGDGSGATSSPPTRACSPRSRTTTTRWSP